MFTDVSHLITSNLPAMHYGAAALDADGDGAVEFVVAGFGGPNRVLKWVSGGLRDVAPAVLADVGRQCVSVAAADLDGDGREEIYVLNADALTGAVRTADRLFDPLPGGAWEDVFERPENCNVRNMSTGRSVAAIDRRGTGRYGFVVANYGRPLRLFELGADGRPLDMAPSLRLDRIAGGRSLWVGPLISERADIFCGNEQGPNFLYVHRGDGTFAERAFEFGLADPHEHSRGVAALDADGNGRLDLAYGNWEGPHRLMTRQPDGTFRDRATPAMALPSTIRTVIAADFDNDGHEELFFNNLEEANRLFGREKAEGERRHHGPDSSFHHTPPPFRLADPGPAALPNGRGTGAAVADIDGDGVLELLVCHGETVAQPLSLFKVPGAAERQWLRVRPLTRFGAPARGAQVRLTADGRSQLRVIDGGSGYLCQMEPVAHFGLREIESVDSVSVTWPDGTRIIVENPPICSTISVPYPLG